MGKKTETERQLHVIRDSVCGHSYSPTFVRFNTSRVTKRRSGSDLVPPIVLSEGTSRGYYNLKRGVGVPAKVRN